MRTELQQHLYRNDPNFKRMVDSMVAALRNRLVTVSVLNDMATLAFNIATAGTVRCPFNVHDVVQLFDPSHPENEQLGIIDAVYTDVIDQVDLRFADDSVSRVSVMNIVRPWI
jgi:hypothetical protein